MGEQAIRRPEPEAMERLLDACAGTAGGMILRLAWLQGLTREEISRLTWAQVDLPAAQLTLPDRAIPLHPEMTAYLARQAGHASPYVVPSPRGGGPMPPESISRLARQALNSAGMQQVRLGDLRHDYILRQMEHHDWPYVVRVSGISVSTLQARYARTPQPESPSLNPGPPREAEIDEFRLWKVLQAEGSSPAGLALWLSWQMGLQARVILARPAGSPPPCSAMSPAHSSRSWMPA